MAVTPRVITFNIKTDDYKAFIQSIRDWAKDPRRFSHGRPVLPYPPQNMHQAECADLELIATDSTNVERTLIAKIRRHDLYIIGYKMHGAPYFLEFKWSDTQNIQYIAGSRSVGFGENYNQMGQLVNLPRVGYNTLKDAIVTLATSQGARRKEAVRALAVMIPEMVRFEKLFEIVAPLMQDEKDIGFNRKNEWMAELIQAWGDLSDLLLKEDQNLEKFHLPDQKTGEGTYVPNDLTTNKHLMIKTASDAAKVLAILKGNRIAYQPSSLALFASNPVGADVGVGADTDIRGKGQAMVEIFSVRITCIGEKDNNGKLYGSIELVDGLGPIELYSLKAGDSEPISANDIVTLQGPYRAISASQVFMVSMDLKSKGSFFSSDDQVSLGSFTWDLCELTNNEYYDKRLTYDVNGKDGSATVYYAPFSDAVQARVEVLLVDADGEDPADVYGSLIARYSNYDYLTDEQKKYYQTTLFKKTSAQHIDVKPGKLIPLPRSVVVVPTTSSLVIEADLWDHNTFLSDDEIAKGVVEFPPQLDGKSTKDIKGKFGLVRVTVAWSGQISE